MTATVPETAMVLAAGRGERLRPLTDRVPKPLVVVDGITMLGRMLDMLAAAGVRRAVVNTHHLAAQIHSHLESRAKPEIVISDEAELLDTGGGIANALGDLGAAPFYAVNTDVVLLDGPEPVLWRMARAWRDHAMDALLLTHRTVRAHGYDGPGDFVLAPEGRLRRRHEHEIVPYLFTGIQLLHPRLFKDCPKGAFSLNRLYDRAAEVGRLHGLAHDGEWLHIGTPASLASAERTLEKIR